MNKPLSLLVFLIVIALPSYAGNLVFEAQEEEEIIISDEKRGASSSSPTSSENRLQLQKYNAS